MLIASFAALNHSPALSSSGQNQRAPSDLNPIAAPTLMLTSLSASASPVAAPQNQSAALTVGTQASQIQPDKLIVTRTKNDLNNLTAPPFTKTIVDHILVQKLYTEILALPSFPSGTFNCPPGSGVQYHLAFYSGAVLILAADYRPTGCPSLQLNDGTVKSGDSAFDSDLWHALGFASDQQFL